MVVLSVGDSLCESVFWRFMTYYRGFRCFSGQGFIHEWWFHLFAIQRVIDRKLYDTDRAEEIAQYAPNTDRSDFHFLVETLYKTTDGEYFLHCEGGAATKYAKSCGGGERTGSEELKPLDEEAALDWCEERAIDGRIVVDEFEELVEI